MLCHAALWSVQCVAYAMLCIVLCVLGVRQTDRGGWHERDCIVGIEFCGCECRGFKDGEYRGFVIIGIEGPRIVNVEV